MRWFTESSPPPLQEEGVNPPPEPASGDQAGPQEAADWQHGIERRQWEVAFKLESLSMQYEELDSVQRKQATKIEELSTELRDSIAERNQLRCELDESHEAVVELRLENQRLHQAIRSLIEKIPVSTTSTRHLEREADTSADQQRGLALSTSSRDSGTPKGGPVDWSFAGERTLLSAGCVSNASTADSSGLAGSSSEGPSAR